MYSQLAAESGTLQQKIKGLKEWLANVKKGTIKANAEQINKQNNLLIKQMQRTVDQLQKLSASDSKTESLMKEVEAVIKHTAAGAAGGVRLMSVHKSKGLEFPVVFLADLNRSFNRQDLDRPVLVHPQLGVGAERVEVERRLRYDTVSKTALALTLEREAKAEELRILYVAMTRAQEKLIMVCSRKNPEKHLKELCALAELPAPPEAVAAVNCPGDWLLLALLSTYQAGVFHDYTGVRPAVLCDGPEGLALRLHRISGEEDGGAAMPAEEPEARAPDPQPDEAALAFRYSHRAATVTPSKVTATQLKGRVLDEEPFRRRL